MNFDDEDKLQLQHLAGGSIVKHAPVFSQMGRFIFLRCGLKVQVFVTSTGELTRELNDAKSPLISLEVDLEQPDLLLGCTLDGHLLHWHWRTGVLQRSVELQLHLKDQQVLTCNLLSLYKGGETASAFVTVREGYSGIVQWFVINTTTGQRIEVNCNLRLKTRKPLVDVDNGHFQYICIAQGYYVYFINYNTWEYFRYTNLKKTTITCVRVNPSEEMAATGDKRGRVMLWREFNDIRKVKCTEYHWHATNITSIAFTPSGVSFYSAAREAVLVKWSLTNEKDRQFVPRMSAPILHIVAGEDNQQVLVCTADNALQFVRSTDMRLQSTMQHFTYALPDETGRPKFPMGLCLNPRTNSMVLNGRVGQLQFYSAYTKSLLYNLRVVDSNVNSLEYKNIIYNTDVTRAAFNINWMATGEEYNDLVNFPELRLKFWQYHEKLQTYQLNTCIEMPHEHGFHVIIFSNQFQVDNLRCATAGMDNVIKLWTPGDSENIYKRGIMWNCVAQASFKQQKLESICFSQDGSILAAGYGHSLVLFDARSLRLLHSLTTSPGYDGVVAKAQLRLSQTPINGTRSELTQQRQQLWGLLQTLLNSNDQKLIDQARQLMDSAPGRVCKEKSKEEASNVATAANVYKHIMQMSELGLHQKLQLLRRFGIECAVHESYQNRLRAHLQKYGLTSNETEQRLSALNVRLRRLQPRHRFKAKLRLTRIKNRRRNYEDIVKHNLLPLFSVLQLDETTKPAKIEEEKSKRWSLPEAKEIQERNAIPFQSCAQISHVQFGAGAQAHLVAVCTETRVLIWNLMTLRLQAGLKLCVKQLAFDPLTNLIAAVTHNNELHVFQPNVPLPIYQRSNLPKLYGLLWLPRRQPKQSSINVDWQAQSTLYMLTQEKEIVYLAEPGQSITDDAPAPISFGLPPVGGDQLMQYATFGAFVAKQNNTGVNTEIAEKSGPLIVGRGVHSAVNALVNLSAHTMPAMSLICGEFIKSLLTPAERDESNQGEQETLSNGKLNGNGHTGSDLDDSEQDEDEEQEKKLNEDGDADGDGDGDKEVDQRHKPTTNVRKILLEENSALEQYNSKEEEQRALDKRLKRVAKLNVSVHF